MAVWIHFQLSLVLCCMYFVVKQLEHGVDR
jgi:hypothetical protein